MILDNIKNFIFPNRCVICDEILPFGDKLDNRHLCKKCRNKIEFIKEPTCKKCGAMIYGDDEIYCVRCKNHIQQSYEYGFGLCRYNDAVKMSLHKIKYEGRKEYIEFYGKCIAKVYYDKIKKIEPSYIVPVPIHSVRYRQRGYNQASVLAHAISKELKKYGIDIEVNENLVFRNKNTKVLNKLSNEDRKKELENAFIVENCGNIEKIILVDDIYTTGSTIEMIASMLKRAGVGKIYFISVAIVDNI